MTASALDCKEEKSAVNDVKGKPGKPTKKLKVRKNFIRNNLKVCGLYLLTSLPLPPATFSGLPFRPCPWEDSNTSTRDNCLIELALAHLALIL